jgi:hypothetical protein
MPPNELDIKFRALDGTVLCGTLYQTSGRGPGIVMSPGVSPNYYTYFLPTIIPTH